LQQLLDMKKTIICLLLVIWVVAVFGQPSTQNKYYDKANTQRIFGVILTIGGAAMVAGGLLSSAAGQFSFLDDSLKPVIFGGGFLLCGGGIFLLSEAKKNEKKGKNFTISMNFERTPRLHNGVLVQANYPSIKLSCHL
jgi:hypothetical protein